MIAADFRRLRKQARTLARKPLHTLIQWIVFHALRSTAGRPLTRELLIEAAVDIQDAFWRTANRGVFRYFDILDATDLGPIPIEIIQVTGDGGCMLAVEPVIEHIFSGGRRGAGWLRLESLSEADLLN